MLRTVGSTRLPIFLLFTASLAAACTNRQDSGANTAANPPPPGGYGAPPPGGTAPGYGAPPPGYGNPGYGTPPPAGYGNPPPPGYGSPPAPGYGTPTPTPTAPPPALPPVSPTPAPGGTVSPTPTAPAGLPSGFPWPFPAPGGATPPPGGSPSPSPGGTGSTGGATPIDPNLASVATVPLMAYAQQEAPGMTREGTIVAGQFREGQTLEQAMQMLPNKCYTVLAVGAGMQEVDITLVAVTPLPGMSPVLAQDSGTGASASLGGKGQCFKWTMPVGINAKFVVKATRGAGIGAAQLYSK